MSTYLLDASRTTYATSTVSNRITKFFSDISRSVVLVTTAMYETQQGPRMSEAIQIAADDYEYLAHEASRLGITIAQAHDREQQALARCTALVPSREVFAERVRNAAPHDAYLVDDQERPF